MSTIASSVLVCSELEQRKAQSMYPNAHFVTVPNTAAPLGELPPASRPIAIFVGTAWYGPNREAISWFANEIWPHIRRAVPEARLIVVGERTEELAVSSPQLGIETLGFVENLAPIYAAAMLAVCPIRRGSGTRIKIIEASINGRPVVSTTLGAEGLLFAPGTEILIADDAKDFADACIRLFRDPAQAALIGEAAAQRARSAYQETSIAERLRAVCADVVRDERLGDGSRKVEAARHQIETRAGLRSAIDQQKFTLRGVVDVVSSRRIAGWAQTVEHPEAPVCLDIYAAGRLIGQLLAIRYRKDLQEAGLGSGCHSFEFTPPAGPPFALDAIEVRRSFDGAILPRSKVYKIEKLTLCGFVDDVSSRRIAGWAQTVEYPEEPVCLDIHAGGRLIGQVLASRYRKDLQEAGHGSGCHSFEFTPPAGLAFALDAVEVCRSLDGASLPRTEACKIAIAQRDLDQSRLLAVIEDRGSDVSSSAASHAQAAAAARRHLVFVGGTSEPGGLHIHTADIARSCADLGCRVTILCTSINYFAPLLEDDAVAIEVIGPLDAMGPQDWLRVRSRLAASAVRPQIVFCCGSLGDIRIVDLAAAYQFGTAVYTIVHRPCEEPWRLACPRPSMAVCLPSSSPVWLLCRRKLRQALPTNSAFPRIRSRRALIGSVLLLSSQRQRSASRLGSRWVLPRRRF